MGDRQRRLTWRVLTLALALAAVLAGLPSGASVALADLAGEGSPAQAGEQQPGEATETPETPGAPASPRPSEESTGPSEPEPVPAPQQGTPEVTLNVPDDAADRLAVPYGVNLAAWLNRQDALYLIGEKGESPQPVAAAQLAQSYFANGAGPLRLADGLTAYPVAGVEPGSALAWEELAEEGSVTLPDLAGLGKAVTLPAAPQAPEDVALAPSEVLDDLRVSAEGGDPRVPAVTPSDDGPVVWLRAGDTTLSTVYPLEDGDPAPLSDSFALNADGTFSSDSAGSSLAVSGLTDAYVKLPEDVTLPDGTALPAGQVLRVRPRADLGAPELGELSALNADGTELSAERNWIDDGLLTVGADGIVVTAVVSDPAVAGTPAANEATSGVDPSSLALSIGGKTVPGSLENGVATFSLSASTVGTGTLSLSDAAISVSDVAGNEWSTPLSDAADLAGITGLRVIDASSQSWLPKVSVSARDEADRPVADGACVQTDEVTVEFTVSDPLLGDLLENESWLACDPLSVTIDGVETSVDPATLTCLGSTSYAATVGAIEGEGRHTVKVSYGGVGAWLPLLGDLWESDETSFLIDRTAPQVTGAALETPAEDGQIAELSSGARVLLSGENAIELTVEDLAQTEGVETSGVASVSATLVRHEVEGDKGTEVDLGELGTSGDGAYVIELDDAGYYPLSDIKITMTDKAGVSSTVTLSEVDAVRAWSFSAVLVDTGSKDSGPVGDGFAIETPEGTPAEAVSEGFYPAGSQVSFTLSDHWFWVRSGTAAFSKSISGTFDGPEGVEALPADMATSGFVAVTGGRDLWRRVLPLGEGGTLADGWYSLAFSYRGWEDAELEFGVDTTEPRLTDAELADPVDPDSVAELADGRTVLAGGERTIRVRVQDLLPRDSYEGVSVEGMNEGHVSGVDEDTLEVTIRPATSADGTELAKPVTMPLNADERGWAEFTLKNEGLYDLDHITVNAYDVCGNLLTTTLADYVATLDEEEAAAWPDAILVDGGEQDVAASLDVTDADGTPASKDPYYHRGDVVVRCRVSDPWLPIYVALFPDEPIVSATLRGPGAQGVTPAGMGLVAADLVLAEGEKDVWEAVWTLPRADEATDALPLEGDYDVRLSYDGIAGALAGGEPSEAAQLFGIDYTAPELGSLSFSETSPLPLYESGDKRDEPWGWIFSRGDEVVSLVVGDNLSGVTLDTLFPTLSGTASSALSYEESASPRSGVVSLTFSGDGGRVLLEGTSLVVEDAAGNRAETGALAAYADSNLPEGAHSVAIDTEAPVIEVSFDNDDVRNGRYYNRARTATVSIDESNFDLLMAHAPETMIFSAYRDGSERASEELVAEDFEPVTLEDGSVRYRASLAIEDDADWRLESGFTDPAQRRSNEYESAFVIDTQAPVIMVTYDNDESANAMYYSAPRTATIAVSDRNFSPELGSIDARSLAGGAAPSVSGWSETSERAEWQTSAHFGGETHYQLSVAASDLAGNVAEPYDSGEFVIDMTAPQVSIGDVEGQVAYAGTVAPTIDYSDANLDALVSSFTLTGARQGDTFLPGASETASATEKSVSLGNFPFEVERDDVYTLSAEAVDLAGNTSEAAVTFSVNRYGSTYYFAAGSEGISGSYLAAPRDVRVVEVNVSGLVTGEGRVELAQDDASRALVAGVDYELDPNAPAEGWSATTYAFPAHLFQEDGFYRLTLTSTDKAGSLSQNTMVGKGPGREGDFPVSFAVDGTAPVAALVGVEPGEAYLDPEKSAIADGHDNLGLSSLEVSMDGEPLASWAGEELSAADVHGVALPTDGIPHTYVVEAIDRAGNVTTATYPGVVVTGDLLTYVCNTPELLALVTGGALVLVGALVSVGYLAVRRYRARERERNPFGHGRSSES